MLNISIERTKNPKEKPDFSKAGFGNYFSDHMFLMDYNEDLGWHNPRIVPYANIPMDPATMVFHYGQETFEGMKAYRTKEGEIQLFRPDMNAKRLNHSNERLSMPQIPEEDFIEAVKTLVNVDEDWIPNLPDSSLYIRPFVYATEVSVGVHCSNSYKLVIITSPVNSYYAEGINPVKIYVEDQYVRAFPGGTGSSKCGGNYATGILSQQRAKEKGCAQVLWLDGINHKYIEEVGTMNVMFKMHGEIYTAPLDGTILGGITRDSCLRILKDWGYKINEEHFSIDQVVEAYNNGELEEVFGTGTAAVISPIGELIYHEKDMLINNGETGELTKKLYKYLTDIQWGREIDIYNWTLPIK